MAHYRKIDSRIWNDEKFTGLSERGQLCFFFLLTHPHTSSLGALRSTLIGLASELFAKHKKSSAGVLEGFGEALLEGYLEAFREVIDKGLVRYDERSCALWFPNFLKYNSPESPNVIRGWRKAYDLIPECEMKHSIFAGLKDYAEALSEGFREAFAEAFGIDFAKSMPNQKQKQNIEDRHTASQYVFPTQPAANGKSPIELPTSNGKPFLITSEYIAELAKAYPDLNLPEQFEKMRVWLDAQSRRKKKATGMKRFIVGWLNREKPSPKAPVESGPKDFVGARKKNADGSYKL